MDRKDKIAYIRKIENEYGLDLSMCGDLDKLNDQEIEELVGNCVALESHEGGR